MKTVHDLTAPHPHVARERLRAGATGGLWWPGSPGPALHSERPIRCLPPATVSEERAVFPTPWPQEHLHVLAGSILSISRRQMSLPISETPHRSRKGVTSAASEGNLQGKHDFKAMFFTLIWHILSPDSG